MHFQYITIICLAMSSMCCGHGGRLSYQVPPQIYCGRVLARSLAILCYDRPSNVKRTEFGSMYNTILTPYYKEQEENSDLGWWIPPNKAKNIGLPSRNKRLVVSECCDKPCKITELMSYC